MPRLVRRLVLAACCVFACLSARSDEPASARRILAGDRLNINVREQADLSRVYPVAGDGLNIPPANLTDGYGIAALYNLRNVD